MEERRDQFDGVRGVLFLAVFFIHLYPKRFECFSYALPVFFVMSGFLISRLLLKQQPDHTLARLKSFYLQRTLRIFPTYYAVVILMLLFVDVHAPLSYLFYFMNIDIYLLSLTPKDASFQTLMHEWTSHGLHLWSLCVEEQFYLLLPPILLYTPVRFRAAMLTVVWLVAIAVRMGLQQIAPRSFYGALLPVVAEYFSAGCLLAHFALSKPESMQRLATPFLLHCSLLLLASSLFIEYSFDLHGYFQFSPTHFQTINAALIATVLWQIWAGPSSSYLIRGLSFQPLAFLGRASYSLYASHLFAISIHEYLLQFVPRLSFLWGVPSIGVITTVLGLSLFFCIEQPSNRFRKKLRQASTHSV